MKILLSLIILENKLSFLQALKIRAVWRVTRLQSKICKGLQDCLSGKVRLQDYKKKVKYKSLSKGEYKSLSGKGRRKAVKSFWGLDLGNLDLRTGPLFWTSVLDLSSVFEVCLFIDKVNHGKSSKVTWVKWSELKLICR